MCGAPSQPQFAARTTQLFLQTVPNAIVIDKLLEPYQLTALLQECVLNVHPALYEAYGLTIVEAAAMGCPTVLYRKCIGAAQLLKSDEGASVSVDISDVQQVAYTIMNIVKDEKRRLVLAEKAYHAAISWSEDGYVAAPYSFAKECVAESAK